MKMIKGFIWFHLCTCIANSFHITNCVHRKIDKNIMLDHVHYNTERLLRSSKSDNNDDNNITDDGVDEENDSLIARNSKEEVSRNPITALPNKLSENTGLDSTEPLFGEVEIDGSIVVLAPAIVIGFFGILTSFLVASQARDEFIDEVELSNSPPPKVVTLDENKCRGICNDQDESFESLKAVMNSLKKSSPDSSLLLD